MLEFYRPYLVAAANIWPWDATLETWGTYLAMRNLSTLKITPVVDTDTMMIFGAMEHGLAVPTGIDLECQFGGLHQEIVDTILGRTRQESGTGDNEVWGGSMGAGENRPYIALGARLSVDGDGDLHVFFPRIKLFGDIPVELSENNAFVKPTVTFKGFRLRKENGDLTDPYIWRRHAVTTALPTVFSTAIADIA